MQAGSSHHESWRECGQALNSVDLGTAERFYPSRRLVEIGIASKGGYQNVGRDDRVAQRQVQALSADGGHRVCGVADQQRVRSRPAKNAIRDGVEQKRSAESIAILNEMIGKFWVRVPAHRVDPFIDATRSQVAVGSFQDDPGDLEQTVGCADRDEKVPASDLETKSRIVPRLGVWQLEPDDIEWKALPSNASTESLSNDRTPTVGADHERCANRLLAIASPGRHAHGDPAIVASYQSANRTPTSKLERTGLLRQGNERLEHFGLRDGGRTDRT
jgi:hypothetical protein